MSVFPYRHQATGPSEGTTTVYLSPGTLVHYRPADPEWYTETIWRTEYINGHFSMSKVSEDVRVLDPGTLAYFESLPTLADRGVTL